MVSDPPPDLPLSPYRVLDLTNETGFLCGRVLGDLGADVIKVEPPGGDPARMHAPFLDDIPDPRRSLYWMAYNFNKRGVTLDLRTADGRELFHRLVQSADFVVETGAPGHMDSLGLGYDKLRQVNPRVVMVSITPFGQTGPYKDYRADDLVAMAAGGLLGITGDADRPPVRVLSPQSYVLAGAQAAAAALLAHYSGRAAGGGRHVDVSVQESVACTLNETQVFWFVDKNPGERGIKRQYGGHMARGIYSASDGYVAAQVFWGPASGGRMSALGRWMDEEGFDADFKRVDFSKITGNSFTPEELNHWEEELSEFLGRFTKAEVYEQARKRRAFMFPVSSPKDLMSSPQLEATGFFQDVDHPELGRSITYPGLFCGFSETPLSIRRRPPLIGEHNLEVFEEELGYTREEIIILKEAQVI